MSLRKKILNKLHSHGKQLTMNELYQTFPEETKTTIRGRVYENIGKGITRLNRGLYISSDAIIEFNNSLESIDEIIKEGRKFNYIFLDIPYYGGGQKGGNRDLFNKDKITPEQFGEFIVKLEKLLLTKDSPISFMFTTGKSSKKTHDKYLEQFKRTNLIMCKKTGTYTKLWSNGNRMNMGKYLMPVENIYFFTKSGNISIEELDFELVPNTREYPTAKPYPMIKSLVKQLSNVGDWVFDPFGGSGKTLKACLELNRKCYIIDNCEDSINNHILKLIN